MKSVRSRSASTTVFLSTVSNGEEKGSLTRGEKSNAVSSPEEHATIEIPLGASLESVEKKKSLVQYAVGLSGVIKRLTLLPACKGGFGGGNTGGGVYLEGITPENHLHRTMEERKMSGLGVGSRTKPAPNRGDFVEKEYYQVF